MAHDATPSLDTHGEFVHRHIGPAEADVAKMLATVGFDSIDALIDAVVPDAIRERTPLELPAAQSEVAVLDELRALAERNEVNTSLIGLGYAGTITPPVILRNVLENPGWYT
ncbi:MAG: glycine dehydrogenase (aminomethyl-transferring), partial [Acidimicrobiales bacterium]|nr:glycine dehydrogenase (aminomethyl-transferring) [Acidimicrobiales bacterium]